MSGTEPPLDGLDPRNTVRQIIRVFRSDKPGWEVLLADEAIGAICQTRIGRSSSCFYEAIGYIPGTGERVGLELSTSFSERFDKLIAFHEDPESSVHLPRHLRQQHRWHRRHFMPIAIHFDLSENMPTPLAVAAPNLE